MTWRQLLGRAIVAEGSQSAVARRLGYSPSAISAVLGGSYNGSAKAIEAAVRNIYGGKTVTEQAVPAGYKRNAIGHLVPIESIKDEDLLRDEFVQRVIEQAIEAGGESQGRARAFTHVHLTAPEYHWLTPRRRPPPST